MFTSVRKITFIKTNEKVLFYEATESKFKASFYLNKSFYLLEYSKTWACANYTVKNERLTLIPFIIKQFKEPISRRKSICGRKYHICHVPKCDVFKFFLINLSDYVNKRETGKKRCEKTRVEDKLLQELIYLFNVEVCPLCVKHSILSLLTQWCWYRGCMALGACTT